MKTLVKFALLAAPTLLMFIADMPTQPVRSLSGFQFVSEAHAQYGRARRTRRRGVAVGYSAGKSAAAEDAAAQPAAAAPQQAAPAPQQAAPPPPQPAAPAAQ